MASQPYQAIGEGTAVGPRAAQITQIAVAPHRPWRQLIDRSAFGRPESFADALQRLKRNLRYFQWNYAIFMLVVIGLSLLWHPISLIVLAILIAAWIYLYLGRSEPLTIFGRTIRNDLVLGGLTIVTIVALFLTTTAAALITGLVLSVVIIVVHGALRRADDLFVDEQENAAS